MALVDLVYRCPRCGHDPLPGKGRKARCPGCGAAFVAARGGGIRISGGGAPPEHRSAREVVAGLELPVGAGGVVRETRARVKLSREETHIPFQGRILGFMEVFGETREGLLRLEEEALTFHPDDGGREDRWPLHRVRSVQASSSSLQITTPEVGLVSIKVPHESIHLWELLIHRTIQEVWRARGLGEITEFQPRIRAE